MEVAQIHKYGIITTLPFSNYASPIFAQRKPNGKLSLLVDLRKIITLMADDYINNNHPVSTLRDAAQHMAGKNFFCKLDCSQAYHCLQMADQQSIELLAFNFASRTFAYQRSAQGLCRSLSAFSSFIREYLDPIIKADQCAQYVDDIGIAAYSRILIEQDSDPTLLNFKREMLGLPFDEQILLNDARYMQYSRNKKRIIIKDDILYRQYYNDIGEVSHLQVLLPGQLLKFFLQSVHGTASNHPGISKMMQEIRQKYYFPSIATYVRNWVRDCKICIQDKRINNTRVTPELIHIPEWDLGPEDLMQINLLPELPPSGGYEIIITAINVFSRYAFAYPVSNPTAVNTAKVIIDIMTRHAYLPTLIITDKGSVFVFQVIHEVAEILGIKLKHATTKHAQTIGVLERTHATIKTSLKIAPGEYRKQWHKYLPIAILNYNTTYHSSIDCEQSRVFLGRDPTS